MIQIQEGAKNTTQAGDENVLQARVKKPMQAGVENVIQVEIENAILSRDQMNMSLHARRRTGSVTELEARLRLRPARIVIDQGAEAVIAVTVEPSGVDQTEKRNPKNSACEQAYWRNDVVRYHDR
jgi:hypothetical protein